MSRLKKDFDYSIILLICGPCSWQHLEPVSCPLFILLRPSVKLAKGILHWDWLIYLLKSMGCWVVMVIYFSDHKPKVNITDISSLPWYQSRVLRFLDIYPCVGVSLSFPNIYDICEKLLKHTQTLFIFLAVIKLNL